MMDTVRLLDRDQIRAFLNTDRNWSAYALGDLDPELYQLSEWFGAIEGDTIRSIVLLFKGLEPPAILTPGDPIGLDQILDRLMHARSIYLSIREEHIAAIDRRYHIHDR